MKRTATAGLVLALLLAALPAHAQDEYDQGIGELALNAGFALPFGNANGGNNPTAMTDLINFAVPFGIQAGYRVAGVVFIGATFSYGPFGSPSTTSLPGCAASGVSCHSSFFRGGVSAQWHPLGSRGLDPYVGLGIGYEWLYVTVSSGSLSTNALYSGFGWVDLPVGLDFRLSKAVRLGPFVDFNLGEYRTGTVSGPTGTGTSTESGNISPRAVHIWLTFGLRLVLLSL